MNATKIGAAINRVAVVNRTLAKAGEPYRLRRGRGYYFFTGGDAASWPTSGVYVNRADALSVGEWLDTLAGLRAARR
jgi:hypothetical protein